MGAIIELLLLSVLCASVGTVQGACRHVQNDDMVEYSCVGGQLSDLDSLPASTGKIRISNMPLPVITRDTLARFGSDLWVFGCSYCEIRDIEPGAFQHLQNLQQLSLDNNQLTTVRESSFRGLDYLTYLDLNYNAISTIEDGVFQTLPSLIDLRLSGNRLECLNLEDMSKLKDLKRMFLTENSEFKCPNAVSAYLESQGVNFEKDPEWNRITEDLIPVELPYDTDYYDSTTMQNTPLPPYRERLHPTSPILPPEQPSTPSYIPPLVQSTEEVVYHPMPDVYDEENEMRPYVPPRTIAPLEPATDPPNQQSGVDETLESWPRLTEPSPTRPRFPPHGNGDSQSEAKPFPLAPVQQQTSSSVESDVDRATKPYTINWTKIIGPLPTDTPNLVQQVSPNNVQAPPSVMAAEPGPTTTDKPLPNCPNSSSTIQRSLGLVILAVLMALAGHGFVEGF
ncbi:uncharacterized protein LOC143358262 [Halictus rubicundus]|uniref:uncharacterized protein LOC143358262 n=1 Tax=Halictus rubicundus TaxID=77578 RepID=UPI00403728A0